MVNCRDRIERLQGDYIAPILVNDYSSMVSHLNAIGHLKTREADWQRNVRYIVVVTYI